MNQIKRLSRARRKAKANRLERWNGVPQWKRGEAAIKPKGKIA